MVDGWTANYANDLSRTTVFGGLAWQAEWEFRGLFLEVECGSPIGGNS